MIEKGRKNAGKKIEDSLLYDSLGPPKRVMVTTIEKKIYPKILGEKNRKFLFPRLIFFPADFSNWTHSFPSLGKRMGPIRGQKKMREKKFSISLLMIRFFGSLKSLKGFRLLKVKSHLSKSRTKKNESFRFT